MRTRILLLMLVPILILVACDQTQAISAEDVSIEVAVNPDPPMMGDATMMVTLTDKDAKPVDGATVKLNATMSHDDMMPVLEETNKSENGVYEIPFQWTMAGDWLVTIEVTLNGKTASKEFDFAAVAGDTDMGGMTMDSQETCTSIDLDATEEAEETCSIMDMDATEEAHDMAGMDMGDSSTGVTGVSGVYMTITNSTDKDVTLVSVSAEGVGMAEIHESIMENNIMRMEYMADGLLIPAGETVELRPGTYHVMLMQLEKDLYEGETLPITLEFDNGTTISLDAAIASVNPEDGLSVENDGITVSLAWARPTALDDMSGMNMEATEESGDMSGMNMEATEESGG